jgi:hypothetical protein
VNAVLPDNKQPAHAAPNGNIMSKRSKKNSKRLKANAKRTATSLSRKKKRITQKKEDAGKVAKMHEKSVSLLADIARELNLDGRFNNEIEQIKRLGFSQTMYALAAADATLLLAENERKALLEAWERGDIISLAATVAVNSPELMEYTKEAIRYVTEPIAGIIGLLDEDPQWNGDKDALYEFIAELLKPTADQIVNDILIRGTKWAVMAWFHTKEEDPEVSAQQIIDVTNHFITNKVQGQALRNRGYYEQLAIDNALAVLKEADHTSEEWRYGVRLLLSLFDASYFESDRVRDSFVSDIVYLVQEEAINLPAREFTALIAWDGAIDAFHLVECETKMFGEAA